MRYITTVFDYGPVKPNGPIMRNTGREEHGLTYTDCMTAVSVVFNLYGTVWCNTVTYDPCANNISNVPLTTPLKIVSNAGISFIVFKK
jgi:hypothetical protein